jgi:mono/diheme cytochrome c family protein
MRVSRTIVCLLFCVSGILNATIVFEKDVLPVFQQACANCHLGAAAMGKLQLGSEAAIVRGGSSGPAIVAGKSSESLLVKRILGTTDAPRMPMGGDPLTAEQVKLIRAWIDQGNTGAAGFAPTENAGPKAADSPLFVSSVRPILAARCYSCHGPGLQQNGLRLDSLDAVLKGGDSGKVVIPGKPDTSRLLRRLLAQERPMMPYGGPALTSAEIASIRQGSDRDRSRFECAACFNQSAEALGLCEAGSARCS